MKIKPKNYIGRNIDKRKLKYISCLEETDNQTHFFFVCGQQIKLSIVARRILELPLRLSDVFPKSKICVKTLVVFSNKLQLELPKVLRRVRLSLSNWGQWRRKCSVDFTSFPQPHSGFSVS